MAVKVKATLSVSGKLAVEYPDSTLLSGADSLIPDALAYQLSLKAKTIAGVETADLRCRILELEEVSE